jgi:homoserine O-acetyltransferase/O-succinyltransferase
LEQLTIDRPFQLENGAVLPELTIAYRTYGNLDEDGQNVIWVFHALTANAAVEEWWPGLFGPGRLLDPDRYFIVCANMLGSCYGSTNARSLDPRTGLAYGKDFPLVTIRDMVAAHQLLQAHLGVKKVQFGIGGSMGGQQLLEWAITDEQLFENICILASNAKHSPWGIAFNEAQRLAIEADSTLYGDAPDAGAAGLAAARAVAMLSYRNYRTYQGTQSERTDDKSDQFLASSYQRYQGEKLAGRFDVLSYLSLSRAMDSHNVGRGRGGVQKALQQIKAKALVIGIHSDVLFPVEEQALLATHIPQAQLELIDSTYGHDGFLIEFAEIQRLAKPFLQGSITLYEERKYQLREKRQNGFGFRPVEALPGTERF